MQLDPYLFFSGDCEEAFKFYQQCLGGNIEALIPHEGTPGEQQVPAEWKRKIMHGRLVARGQVLMGSDAPPDHYHKPQGFSLSVQIDDASEAERIFQQLSSGGSVHMPLQETFWAVRFGMFVDRFGIPWMVNCPKPM